MFSKAVFHNVMNTIDCYAKHLMLLSLHVSILNTQGYLLEILLIQMMRQSCSEPQFEFIHAILYNAEKVEINVQFITNSHLPTKFAAFQVFNKFPLIYNQSFQLSY